jgi:hypothetical protein
MSHKAHRPIQKKRDKSTVPVGSANAQDAGKRVIATPNAPEAIGPYSQAIRVGNTVYLAGQIAIDPKTGQVMANASIRGSDAAGAREYKGRACGRRSDYGPHRHYDGLPQGPKRLRKDERGLCHVLQERAARPGNCRGRPPTSRHENRDFGNRRASIVVLLAVARLSPMTVSSDATAARYV